MPVGSLLDPASVLELRLVDMAALDAVPVPEKMMFVLRCCCRFLLSVCSAAMVVLAPHNINRLLKIGCQ